MFSIVEQYKYSTIKPTANIIPSQTKEVVHKSE